MAAAGAAIAAAVLLFPAAGQQPTPEQRAVMERITADSLRGHLSFIASDALEGRGTPSRGLDLAAEYIAAQFRRAGLEPAADGGYFQSVTIAELGAAGARIIRRLGPDAASATVRNVAGILRGSDPALADTYVILSAHYDHVGVAESGEDRIYNGANDDGSGTVSVIEVAAALAGMNPHPKRSILFLAFFGEESGLAGSRYYSEHPLAPPAKTIAHLNLEQVGRTDASNGPQLRSANLTGWDFSNLPAILADAAAPSGVRIWKDGAGSDPFFSRSDNAPLAALGIPAHTLSVAYEFPDYHKATDHWDKIDYENMAAVARAVALGLMRLASDAPPPEWNADYPAAQRYVEAARRLHSGAVE
jgi:hypothetical protein